MKCGPSGFKVVEELSDVMISFIADGEVGGEKIQIIFYPFSHKIYLGVTLTRHGKNVIGEGGGLLTNWTKALAMRMGSKCQNPF